MNGNMFPGLVKSKLVKLDIKSLRAFKADPNCLATFAQVEIAYLMHFFWLIGGDLENVWRSITPSLALFMAFCKSKPWMNKVAKSGRKLEDGLWFSCKIGAVPAHLKPRQFWNGFFHHRKWQPIPNLQRPPRRRASMDATVRLLKKERCLWQLSSKTWIDCGLGV